MSRRALGTAFSVDTRPGRRGVTVIEAAGELDFYTAPMLRRSVLESIAVGNALVVLDLVGLNFLDSTGLAVLIRSLKVCRAAGGALALVRLPPRPEHTLRAAGVLVLFDRYTTVEGAESALAQPRGVQAS